MGNSIDNPAEDVSRELGKCQRAGAIELLNWFKMKGDEWEDFAEQHLEPLIEVGASPCPAGLVFRGMVIVPTGTTTTGAVIFTCFSEPDWQSGPVVSWDGKAATDPAEVELEEIAPSLNTLLSEP